jgi:hypothetical protein
LRDERTIQAHLGTDLLQLFSGDVARFGEHQHQGVPRHQTHHPKGKQGDQHHDRESQEQPAQDVTLHKCAFLSTAGY